MSPVGMTNGLCQCRAAFTMMGIRSLPSGGAMLVIVVSEPTWLSAMLQMSETLAMLGS